MMLRTCRCRCWFVGQLCFRRYLDHSGQILLCTDKDKWARKQLSSAMGKINANTACAASAGRRADLGEPRRCPHRWHPRRRRAPAPAPPPPRPEGWCPTCLQRQKPKRSNKMHCMHEKELLFIFHNEDCFSGPVEGADLSRQSQSVWPTPLPPSAMTHRTAMWEREGGKRKCSQFNMHVHTHARTHVLINIGKLCLCIVNCSTQTSLLDAGRAKAKPAVMKI